jgi:hypothetical protein
VATVRRYVLRLTTFLAAHGVEAATHHVGDVESPTFTVP